MPMRINAGADAKRVDLFCVNPDEVIVKAELRGRFEPPPEYETIELATSIFKRQQQNAIRCRRVENNRIMVTSGFGRLEAIKLIRKGFVGTDGEFYQDADRTVKVTITDSNEEEALLENIDENRVRSDNSDMDDAINQRRLRDLGWSDTQIATHYGYGGVKVDTSKVSRLRRLLGAPRHVQMMIHRRELKLQAALDMMDLPEDHWNDVLEGAKEENGKVNSAVVRSAVRDRLLENVQETDTVPQNGEQVAAKVSPVKTKARSVAEIRAYWTAKSEKHPSEPLRMFAESLLAWVAGAKTDKQMDNAVSRFLESEDD